MGRDVAMVEQMLKTHMDLLRAPHEALSKFIRMTQRSLEKELQQLVLKVTQLAKRTTGAAKLGAAGLGPLTAAKLQPLVARLRAVRAKLEKARAMELALVERLCCRAQFLDKVLAAAGGQSAAAEDTFLAAFEVQLERLVAHHLLRHGRFRTAKMVVDRSPFAETKEMVDLDIFKPIQRVAEALRKKDTAPALAWCGENRSRLAKISSSLEFNLRLQEYLELVRAEDVKQAIPYAKTHLMTHKSTNMKQILQAMGLLAFINSEEELPDSYVDMVAEDRWAVLEDEFIADAHRICCLSEQSMLVLSMQAGITALKTGACQREGESSANCPLCQPPMTELAHDLPLARWQTSMLRCWITGKPFNEDNAAMALPNGFVYSEEGLASITKDGSVCCPRTAEEFTMDEAKKIFIT